MRSDFTGLLALACAALVIVVIVLCVQDCDRQGECRDSGGHVEHYNYRTIFMTQSCGENCTMLVPVETSDWRCVK